jgi:hypothetical protein
MHVHSNPQNNHSAHSTNAWQYLPYDVELNDANASSTRGYDTWMQHFDSISSGVTCDTRHVEASSTAMTRGGKYLWTRLPYIILDTWRQHLDLTPTQILQHSEHSMMNNLHIISSYLG